MAFPERRMRRLRRTPALRRLVAETCLSPADFVAPLFVREGIDVPQPIALLPGVYQHSIESAVAESKRLVALGVPGICLFGIPEHKDAVGSQASDRQGIIQRTLGALRSDLGDEVVLIPDLCMDEYTDHGHCGLLDRNGAIDNDATLSRYGEIAIAQADAGADLVAPSGMMDGQVAAIRRALDGAGHHEVGILAYSAKYASSFYGPFREAVNVELRGGDRRSHQQDPPNRRESLMEVRLDIEEGADMVMVKPAMTYLDVIAEVAANVDVPVAAYHVSGEYAMLVAAAERQMLDRSSAILESMVAIKRAGADCIISYFAGEVAELLAATGS